MGSPPPQKKTKKTHICPLDKYHGGEGMGVYRRVISGCSEILSLGHERLRDTSVQSADLSERRADEIDALGLSTHQLYPPTPT